jgi:hypothetical protein
MTADEAIADIKAKLVTRFHLWELATVFLWTGKSPVYGKGVVCMFYYASPLAFVERLEDFMADKWPKEFPPVYSSPPCLRAKWDAVLDERSRH